jgi:hypothetical protein
MTSVLHLVPQVNKMRMQTSQFYLQPFYVKYKFSVMSDGVSDNYTNVSGRGEDVRPRQTFANMFNAWREEIASLLNLGRSAL